MNLYYFFSGSRIHHLYWTTLSRP